MSFMVNKCDFCKIEKAFRANNYLSKDTARSRPEDIGAVFPWSTKKLRGVHVRQDSRMIVDGVVTRCACPKCYR